jgi:ion channel-forming bestrophin family protein
MITYNPKDWFKLIFEFHKSDTFRRLLPAMIILAVATGILVFLEVDYFHLEFKSSTIFHQILGFVLSMLLVFRINTAYDRWWEGRKNWGSLVNNTRNLMVKIETLLPHGNNKDKIILKRLIITFVFCLKNHLKDQQDSIEINSFEGFDKAEFLKHIHKPNYLAKIISDRIYNLNKQGVLSDTHLLLLNEELGSLLEITGACERIKNTPIPYAYSIFLKKIIFIYVISMPLAFAFEFGFWSIPIVVFIFYAFASLELISEEIEDPFGDDANDLPTQEISEKIKASLDEITKG